MKTMLFILSVIFAALTLGGMFYVLNSGGSVHAGIAVVPMVLES